MLTIHTNLKAHVEYKHEGIYYACKYNEPPTGGTIKTRWVFKCDYKIKYKRDLLEHIESKAWVSLLSLHLLWLQIKQERSFKGSYWKTSVVLSCLLNSLQNV